MAEEAVPGATDEAAPAATDEAAPPAQNGTAPRYVHTILFLHIK